MIMRFESRNYQESLLVAANIYLLVALVLKLYTQKEVAEYFPEKSGYLFNDSLFFNQIFKEFLQIKLGVSLSELLPYIQHSARFYWFVDKVAIQSAAFEPLDSSQDQTVSKLLFPSSTKGNRGKSSSIWKSGRKKTPKVAQDHGGQGQTSTGRDGNVSKRPMSSQKQALVAADKSSAKLSDVATPQRNRRSKKDADAKRVFLHQHYLHALRSMLEHPDMKNHQSILP
jgi:hypothetical protein